MKDQKTPVNNPRNFLYVRVSSVEQVDGDGIKRQVRLATESVERLGITLNQTFVDAGVSAKQGKNRAEGTEFHKMLQTVKAGDKVFIEDNDRFGRDGYRGLVELQDIVGKHQISFRIISTGVEVNAENFERMDILLPNFLKAVIAKDENDKKTNRIREALAARRAKISQGEVIRQNRGKGAIQNVPAWIDSASWSVNGMAEIVSSVFTSYLIGKGPASIARDLNGKNVPTFSKGGTWGQSVIYKLLSDRRTIGEYRNGTEWVKGYYPAAVTEETFLKVQAKMNDNRGKRPTGSLKDGSILNLFSGVGFCRCGQPLKVTNGNGGKYVTCWGKIRGLGCQDGMVQYKNLESSFSTLLKLHREHFIQNNTVNSALEILNGRLALVERTLETMNKDAAELSAQGISAKGLWVEISKQETQKAEILKQIEIESARTVATNGSAEEIKDIISKIETLGTDNEFRMKVQGWIRQNVNRITVNKVEKTYTIDLKSGSFVTMGLDGSVRDVKSFTNLFTNMKVAEKQERRFINV